MKKILVYPGQRLSLQMHYHRSEHWIVTGGTAQVTVGDKIMMVLIPLEIVEVQNGKYLGEDDIVRFDDVYGEHS